MSERFKDTDGVPEDSDTTATTQDMNAPVREKQYLNLIFFMGKLFSRHENREINEVDLTLQLLKAALTYKDVDLDNPFAEDNTDNFKKP